MNAVISRRRGITLIEMLVVMVVTSLLLAMGVVLYSAVLKSQRQFSLRERERRELSRIEAALRSDTHAASVAEVKEPDQLELKRSSGDAWAYRREADRLLRTRSKDGVAVQREEFHLQPGAVVEFRLQQAGKRTWLAARIETPTASGHAPGELVPWESKFLIGGLVVEHVEESP
jgi:prepilin-type N-terminal cleavage/methylation domain-containing protein